jgi:hypothetical protein
MLTSSGENKPVIVFRAGVMATLIPLDNSLKDHKESWVGNASVTFFMNAVFKGFFGVEGLSSKNERQS